MLNETGRREVLRTHRETRERVKRRLDYLTNNLETMQQEINDLRAILSLVDFMIEELDK